MNLQLTLSFYRNIKFSFIPKQISERKFRVLLEISDKFSSKLNAFSHIILQCWLNIFENFVTILYDSQKRSGLVVLLEGPWLIQAKVYAFKEEGWNFKEEGKYMMIKVFIW